MEDVRLADLWHDSLVKNGWNSQTALHVPFVLAKSTQQSYDRIISDIRVFCMKKDIVFPPVQSCDIADYLCHVAKKSDRPKSSLNSTMSALSALYHVLELPNPCNFHVKSLYTALIKTHTKKARVRTKVMPIEPFHVLFKSWKSNHELSIKFLRLKCISLLAFAYMLRPSDIAPKSVSYDSDSDSFSLFVFSRSQVIFSDDGSLTITFFAIKNDGSRDGFDVTIPPCDDIMLDPVCALKDYMCRTSNFVDGDSSPVFVSLNKPFKAISAATVGSILAESIALAGLDSSVFTPKCFRPSGATRAVDNGFEPDKVRRIGRWKTSSVFFEHYVFDKTPDQFSNVMFDV